MRSVVQRSRDARVVVDGTIVGHFDGPGLVALIGVTHDDTPAIAAKLADKMHELRIFGMEHAPEGSEGFDAKELSASDLRLPILVVSQFTLYGATTKGRRPTWDGAAPGPVAEPLVDAVVARLRERGATVATGVFGADMQVTFTNDGPFTVLLEV